MISRIQVQSHLISTREIIFTYYHSNPDKFYISFTMSEIYLGYRPGSLVKKANSLSIPTYIGVITNPSGKIVLGIIEIKDVIILSRHQLQDTKSKTFDGITPWLEDLLVQIHKSH